MTRFTLLLIALLAGCGGPQVIEGPIAPRQTELLGLQPVAGTPAKTLKVEVDAEAVLTGRRATVTWTLTVANRDGGNVREGEFYLHAPPGIAIDRLALDVTPGTLSPGRAAPALSAAAVYERITRRLIDPALLERIDAQRYRLRIFPLDRPRTVQIRYHAVLPVTAQGMILEIPRPLVVGEPATRPDAVTLRIRQGDVVRPSATPFGTVLPPPGDRVEAVADGDATITQLQIVPAAPPRSRALTSSVVALDHGLEATVYQSSVGAISGPGPVADPHLNPRRVVHGAGDWSAECADLYCGERDALSLEIPRRSTDLMRLVHAAHPVADKRSDPLVVVTAGHDRWHDVEWLARGLTDRAPIHFIAVGQWRNLSGLATLAEATGGHFVQHGFSARTDRILAEPKLTDLRVEVLEGEAEWLPLPRSHVAGTPLVLTARHRGPLRARLHAMLDGAPIVLDLPTEATPGDAGIKALWHRTHLAASWTAGGAPQTHQAISLREGLVTRTVSQVVFEREQDYTAAQSTPPAEAPAPSRPDRVVVTDSRIQIMEKIFFEPGKAVVRAPSTPILDAMAEILALYPSIEFAISGHTDDREARPGRLGSRRASAVAKQLIMRGVDPRRMTFLSYGATRPIHHNKTAEGRAHNRRVEFRITRYHGHENAPIPGAMPLELGDADRATMLDWLLENAALGREGDFAAKRDRLSNDLKLTHIGWLYSPEGQAALLAEMPVDGLSRGGRVRLARLLAATRAWRRLIELKLTAELTDAEMLTFLKADPTHACAPIERCVRLIEAVAAANPRAVRVVVHDALTQRATTTLPVLKRAPRDLAIAALHQRIAHPTVTARDFWQVAYWAQALGEGPLACQALARSVSLSRALAVPLVADVPIDCVLVGLNQRQPGWRRAHLVALQRYAQAIRGDRVVRHLPVGRPMLILDLPAAVEVQWQGNGTAGSITTLTPGQRQVTTLDAATRRQPIP